MSCILFEVSGDPRVISFQADGVKSTTLSATFSPHISVEASGERIISADATPVRSTKFEAALVCGNSLGVWEYLWASDALLITSDGEKLLVRRNI